MLELRSTGARALIVPERGGRLQSLVIAIAGREDEVLWQPGDPEAASPFEGGAFPMAPWPNRVAGGRFGSHGRIVVLPTGAEGHALHGLVYNQEWHVLARTSRVAEMECALPDAWPWAGKAWQRVELGADSLRLKLEVRSSREPFPAACGWHPWFRRDAFGATGVSLTVPAGERYVLEAQLPTGELVRPTGVHDLTTAEPLGARRLDDCYRALRAPVRIRWDRVELDIDMACAAPHVMVYTPPHAFCVEPQTAPPDAFNLARRGLTGIGEAVAAPGRPVSIETRWSWGEAGEESLSGSATRPASRT
jgi:aldose 1-epimerase